MYTLGEDVRNAPEVRPFSPGDLLAKGVHVVSYLAPLLPSVLDLHTEARALSFRDASFGEFLSQLRKSDWSESRDATPFDATFQAAEEREIAREGAPNARTYYRSYCATLVRTCELECQSAGLIRTTGRLRRIIPLGNLRDGLAAAKGIGVAHALIRESGLIVRFLHTTTDARLPASLYHKAGRRKARGGGSHRYTV